MFDVFVIGLPLYERHSSPSHTHVYAYERQYSLSYTHIKAGDYRSVQHIDARLPPPHMNAIIPLAIST